MFKDIGKKIKGLASTVFCLEVIASLMLGLLWMTRGDGQIFVGIAITLVGPIVAWLNALVLYGFGELIDKVTSIEGYLYGRPTVNADERKVTLDKLLADGLISDDEYRSALFDK